MEKYTVLTKASVMNIDTESEAARMALVEEQFETLKAMGFEPYSYSKCYNIRFFDNVFHNEQTKEMTIEEAVECLAIKEGYDLVKFDNGSIGFVSYYNSHKDGFEIIG